MNSIIFKSPFFKRSLLSATLESIVLLSFVLLSFSPPAEARSPDPKQSHIDVAKYVKDQIIKHSPIKQFNVVTKKPRNLDEGLDPEHEHYKTVGSACESLRFLVSYSNYKSEATDVELKKKIEDLKKFILDLQTKKEVVGAPASIAAVGGFRAYPDLMNGESIKSTTQRHYSIDAALCGEALLSLYEKNKDKKILAAAEMAGSFLIRMQDPNILPFPFYKNAVWNNKNEPVKLGGYIELVDISDPSYPSFDNKMHVKNLLSVSFMNKLSVLTNKIDYNNSAMQAVAFLKNGLKEGHEFYSPKSLWTKNAVGWERNADGLIYADSFAYALRSLAKLPAEWIDTDRESPSQYLQYVYFKYNSSVKSLNSQYENYSTNLFWSGYLKAVDSEIKDSKGKITGKKFLRAEAGSYYYDVVTAGILYPTRNIINPQGKALQDADFNYLSQWLAGQIHSQAFSNSIFWAYEFGYPLTISNVDNFIDMTTLANLGEASLQVLLNSKSTEVNREESATCEANIGGNIFKDVKNSCNFSISFKNYLDTHFCRNKNQLNWQNIKNLYTINNNVKLGFTKLSDMCSEYNLKYLGKK